MKYNITEQDKLLLLQKSIDYKYKLLVVDNRKNVLDELEGIQSIGNYNINADSSIRRTTSFTLFLDPVYNSLSVEDKLYQWIGYNFELQIGIYNLVTDNYQWYKCGYYLITEFNTSYDATNNSISTTLSDWYSRLDGTRNGQIGGAPTILIPNEDDDGNPVTIKQATENMLKSETIFEDYIVDDIGEFYGMPQNNVDYEEYRKQNPLWNQLPYDLEYQAGCNVSEIFDEIVNLYPNCQMYFDVYGNFCFNMIPSCEYDPIVFDNDYIQQILIGENSESATYSISEIKNVTEIFGADYEVDRYDTTCTTSNDTYTLTLDDYTEYRNYEYIAFIPDSNNLDNMKVCINDLDVIPIYYDETTDLIKANEFIAGETYVLLLREINDTYVAYYLGQYQPHAICILSNDENDTKYTKSYFAEKYNCKEKDVVIRIEQDSPFAVQKLGEILDCKTGDNFDNILSDSVARENAIYYNRKSSSLNDTVTITTEMIPFLDTNTKIQYKKQQGNVSYEYIIKEIDNDTENNTTTITMYRFYPLYYVE